MRRLGLALLLVLLAPPAWAQVTWQQKSGSITTAGTDCSVATRCVTLGDATRASNAVVQIAGTWSGTLQFEGTIDGTNWRAWSVQPMGSTSFVTSTTTTGAWANPYPALALRVRASALASGAATVAMIVTSAHFGALGSGAGGGSVTSIATTSPVGGGTITSTGTITCTTCVTTAGLTTNALPKAGTSPAIGDSLASDNGTTLTYTGTGGISGVAVGITGSTAKITQAKITASASAPGAGIAKLEWVAGTDSGTCKLIAYAGTSTTAVTLIDNVGGSC